MLDGLQKLAEERGPAAVAMVVPQLMSYLRSVSAGGDLASPLACVHRVVLVPDRHGENRQGHAYAAFATTIVASSCPREKSR